MVRLKNAYSLLCDITNKHLVDTQESDPPETTSN